ncbi:MAG: transposase [Candidatus Paceibacterota bacterium]
MSHILGEKYHIYNRGAHKAPIFLDRGDYERFITLLYTANDTRRVDLRSIKPLDMFQYNRDIIVDIFAYCLMPNHFHIGVEEKTDGGITRFIRKLCTSYAMYYNRKYDHSGTIFQGQYKEKHIDNDEYLRYLIQYIHLNPYSIDEPDLMKTAKPEYLAQAIEYSKKYEFSSYKDYLGENRPQGSIIRVYAG